MAINLLNMESERRFEELCQSLLREEYQRFQAFSSPDAGMDGYDADTETIFQAYFPERAPRRNKILSDIKKAIEHGDKCKRWVLLLPKNPTPILIVWVKEFQPKCRFKIEIWGKNEILLLLRKHPDVSEQFFPTQLHVELQRLSKGRKPATGDAAPGKEITTEQAGELRELLTKLAEEEVGRKRRPFRAVNFQREYGEFNAYFRLSAYDRLPSSVFGSARAYLERKLYARRNHEPSRRTRYRLLSGIKAIQKQLALTDSDYRAMLIQLTGKPSTSSMDKDELKRVFDSLRYKQSITSMREDF